MNNLKVQDFVIFYILFITKVCVGDNHYDQQDVEIVATDTENFELDYPAVPVTKNNATEIEASIFAATTHVNCTKVYSCLDCHTVRVCRPEMGEFLEVTRAPCPKTAPWCHSSTGTCVTDQPPDCLVRSDFSCIRDGLFPDMTECRNYHKCVEGTAYNFRCPSWTPYFNVGSEVCERTNLTCAPSSVCDEKEGVKSGILDHMQLFAYCVRGNVAALDRCLGQCRFNQISQLCEPHCPHAGLFPGIGDCKHFYQCTPSSKWAQDFTLTHHTCPDGQGFLERSHTCVDESLVSNCKVPADVMS